jgi:hypothetical protein
MNQSFPWGFPAATAFYLALVVSTLFVHMVFMHYVLGGAAYLAGGRLFGRRLAAACGWQAMLVDWMPLATGLAITTGIAPLLFLQILYREEFYTANLLLSHRWMAILPVLILSFYLLYLQKSAWLARRGSAARIAVAWLSFAGFGFIAWSWTENHLLSLDRPAWPGVYAAAALRYEHVGLLPRLATWLFLCFPTLALELLWQGWLYGDRFDRPAGYARLVAGLSPLRRLAIMAFAGLCGAACCGWLYGTTLPEATRTALTGSCGRLWLGAAVAGGAVQACVWLVAVLRDRLGMTLALMATLGWAVWLAGILVVREVIRLAAVDVEALAELHARAATVGGLPVFLVSAVVTFAAIGWWVAAVRRETHAGPGR